MAKKKEITSKAVNGVSSSAAAAPAAAPKEKKARTPKPQSVAKTKQYLSRGFNQSRSLELSPAYLKEFRKQSVMPSRPDLQIAVQGRIAAGAPVMSFEANETLNFSELVTDRDLYALQVRGESMIEDHICDGDFVLIERTGDVRNGDIVVALIKGAETTLKRFYKEPDGMVRLQPANSTMNPILVPLTDLEIQGKLLAVLRKYR